MRIANLAGRAVLVIGGRTADVAEASEGRFGPDPMSLFADWDAFETFASTITRGTADLVEADLGAPVPQPGQVFAIGLNCRGHAEESGMALPTVPSVFTKFPACLTGPFNDVVLASDSVDWEVELVVVIGRRADAVAEQDAWSHVAGITIGQDVSDRHLQFAAGGQFSLGKSRRTFGPTGPRIVTPDELDDPDDLELGCSVNGAEMQRSRTSDLVFSIARLIAELSAVLTLWPGDLIFTGTPAGIGATRTPPQFLGHGDVLESWIGGVGRMRNGIRR